MVFARVPQAGAGRFIRSNRMTQQTLIADENLNRCPACKAVTDADAWEVGGACPGFQFCPACGVECEPINLYLEALGCEQAGRINHDGPAKAERENEESFAKMFRDRCEAQEAARPTSCQVPRREATA